MNNFATFLSKEILEIWRKKRLVVLVGVFVFFALTMPLLERYSEEFINLFMTEEQAAAFEIEMPPPHWTGSYGAFYGMVNQIGMIALILLVMGVVVSEKRRGTAALMMVKGLNHSTFILTKFVALSFMIFIALLVSLTVNHFLTAVLFEQIAQTGDLIAGFAVYLLFAMMMLSMVILASTIAQSLALAAVAGFLGFMAMSLPSNLPNVRDWWPYAISFDAVHITVGLDAPDRMLVRMLMAAIITALFLFLSIFILRKKEL